VKPGIQHPLSIQPIYSSSLSGFEVVLDDVAVGPHVAATFSSPLFPVCPAQWRTSESYGAHYPGPAASQAPVVKEGSEGSDGSGRERLLVGQPARPAE
jgi:hypothetical protein